MARLSGSGQEAWLRRPLGTRVDMGVVGMSAPGWVLVNVATQTDKMRLAAQRIGPQGNDLGGSCGDDR